MGAAPVLLELDDLRVVAAFAVNSAEQVLPLFERRYPADTRPRDAIAAARIFAAGGPRVKALRTTALAALKAAGESDDEGAAQAARAAMCAASSAYLHPLASATQVKHILGASAHAARALEIEAGDDATVGTKAIELIGAAAGVRLAEILGRYPPAPEKGGRVGELMRELDRTIRTAG